MLDYDSSLRKVTLVYHCFAGKDSLQYDIIKKSFYIENTDLSRIDSTLRELPKLPIKEVMKKLDDNGIPSYLMAPHSRKHGDIRLEKIKIKPIFKYSDHDMKKNIKGE